jgi:hypothetical protein
MMRHCGQIRRQCLDCGQSTSNALKHGDFSPDYVANLPDFDRDLQESFWKLPIKEERTDRELEKAEWREKYNNYIKNDPGWLQKRSLVIHREDDRCQGCGLRPIHHIHHLTYANLFNELLYQLVGLCKSCHTKAHPDKE